MRARTWQMIPSSRGISALYLVGGVLPGLQVSEERGHAGQPASDGSRGQPGLAILQPHYTGPAGRSLLSQERKHVRPPNVDRLLTDHREEHLQVIGGRPQRVRTCPGRHERQIVVQQRMAQTDRPDPAIDRNGDRQQRCERQRDDSSRKGNARPGGPRITRSDHPHITHESTEMTAHYARITDQTVRRQWEKATKVNVQGERVVIDPDGPLAQAQWAKTRYGIATQTLPHGYCGLPVQQSCPHANACLTCPVFLTGPEFLPELREHRGRTLTLIQTAETAGHGRVAQMNRQVLTNLDKMISGIQTNDASSDLDRTTDAI